jgi:hypothetical protein
MFLLTNNYAGEATDVKGVFTTVEKAKQFTENVMNRDNLKWSDPSHNINGDIWANSGGGYLRIERVEVDPID